MLQFIGFEDLKLMTFNAVPDLTLWDWLFESSSSPLQNKHPSTLSGFTNVATKERVRYDEVKDYATYLSTALVHKLGLAAGETVSLFSPNSIWYPVAMFATNRVGGLISGASPAYNVEEMTYALQTAQAKIIMAAASSLSVAVPAARNAGISNSHIILLEGQADGFSTVKDLLEFGQKYGNNQVAPYQIPAGRTNRDVCGFLSFSSGTTGLPKAVMISHSNVIAQCLQVAQITADNHTRVLAVLPLFHITGLVHQMHLPLFRNSEVYMLPTFTMQTMLETVVQYQISEMLLVPPILIRLLRDPIVQKYDLSHVRKFSSGAAPLSAEVIQALKSRFPNAGFKQGYGMTESCSCITAHPLDKSTYEYAHRVGTIVASTEVKIVDPDTGKELGYDMPGEILSRGPQIVMGYLNNEKATRETFDDEQWLHTGDIGFIDSEGFITITDRIKEMIKVKGIAVAPAELEDLLLGHPIVEDVAVGAIPDEYTGQRPKAYVVLKQDIRQNKTPGQILSLLDVIIDYVRKNKVRHKWISEAEMLDEIPKSASGKILRRILRQMESEKSMKGRLIATRGEIKAKI
ncbi:hypothetical protein N7509_008146 [Penicillium cosmopolitanum]|uniref:Uncharacterized protein n=1 Tax=Penicillium cosmopolitanum TaxID=1131564 RepID=A0A9W9W0F4_9EURO|nr:uncharacterized protein N7509_008146 [Penicillium cosmopolitanum]KAJ5392656.1 hypothetical protein N7509_008146 [Penicillium cosmopolitanum]